MLKEFKEFAMRGNMVDMAVGIIIGAAFGAMVASLLADIIMPPVGLLLGNVAIVIGAAVIAPLLGPNVALALATTLGDTALARRAFQGIENLTVAISLSL